jgi:hypothetical protein
MSGCRQKQFKIAADKNGWRHWRLTKASSGHSTIRSGREFVTLKDAGNYITKLPKAEHEALESQAATQALILVATKGGPTMLARIGVMRALNRHHVREFKSDGEAPSMGESASWRGSN